MNIAIGAIYDQLSTFGHEISPPPPKVLTEKVMFDNLDLLQSELRIRLGLNLLNNNAPRRKVPDVIKKYVGVLEGMLNEIERTIPKHDRLPISLLIDNLFTDYKKFLMSAQKPAPAPARVFNYNRGNPVTIDSLSYLSEFEREKAINKYHEEMAAQAAMLGGGKKSRRSRRLRKLTKRKSRRT